MASCSHTGPDPLILTADEQAELWLTLQAERAVDVWAGRYAVRVTCHTDTLEVVVTRPNEERPLTTDQAEGVRTSVESGIRAALTAKGWTSRYRTVSVRWVP
jgi:hypothetical protein